jgi:hypothetical protein
MAAKGTLILCRKIHGAKVRRHLEGWPKHTIASAISSQYSTYDNQGRKIGDDPLIGTLVEILYNNGTLSKAQVLTLIGPGWEEWKP